jgi:hypothetical protein
MSQLKCGPTIGARAAGVRANEHFPDPFYDMASMAFPDTIQEALRACEDVVSANGPYREAIRRVISYFITDIEVISQSGEELGHEEKKKYEDFLNDTLGIKSVLQTVALDFLTYGNSFTSLLVPFRRYLSCKGCGLEAPLKKIYNTPEFAFSWSNFEFQASCPHCNYRGTWRHVDRRSGEQDQIKVKRWNPHEIDILHDAYTDDVNFIWKIPDDYRSQLRRGHLFHLERASWEIVQAVKGNQHLLFDRDVVYHMKEDTLSGIKNRGWGISRVLTNFRQAYYVQVLHRYNEAIALDYVIPFRVITPVAQKGAAGDVNDPVLSINMGSFASRVATMIANRRRDPARWNVLPFPIEYQALGGDATQLAPKDLIEQGLNTLLAAIGVPINLYNGDITMQTAGPGMRLFEANWAHLVHNLNRFLGKLVDKIAQVMSWEPVRCRLQRVTHADDLNKQMAYLQLMMGGQISKTTGLGSIDLDFLEEQRRKLEEDRLAAEGQAKEQKKMEQQAQMDEMAQPPDPSQQQASQAPGVQPGVGGAPAGGDPSMGQAPAPGQMGPMGMPMGPYGAMQGFMAGQPMIPNKPTTVEEMQQIASTLAQQIIQMPESQKDSALIQLRKEDPTIHALVKSQLEEMKRAAQAAGTDAMMQQMYGAAGGGQPGSQAPQPGAAPPAGMQSAGQPKQAAAQLPVLSFRDIQRAYGKELRTISLD